MNAPPPPFPHLLPPPAGKLEKGLATVTKRIEAIPVPVREVEDPWRCPAQLLDFLAFAYSVDLWLEDWPDLKKRKIIAEAIETHRLKGTLAGIRRMLSYVDVEILKVYRPPAKVYSGPSLTRKQREAWLSKLPQVRFFFVRERSKAKGRIFSGGPRYRSFIEGSFTGPNNAAEHAKRRARWVVNGKETAAKVEQFGSAVRVQVPARRPLTVFSGIAITGKRFFVPSTAPQRIVTIQPVSTMPWRRDVGPRLTPVTSEPELVAQRGILPKAAVISKRCFGRRFFLPSTAGLRLFERYAVNDGSALVKRPAIQFMGVGRYGQPAHTAELKVRIRSKKSRIQAGEGVCVPRKKFWIPHDPKPLDLACRAAVSAKRKSDVILFDTKTKPGFIAGLPFIAGRQDYLV